jgi:DtxR family transcriptional regulator, Mn-dependent transcriptional regulator
LRILGMAVIGDGTDRSGLQKPAWTRLGSDRFYVLSNPQGGQSMENKKTITPSLEDYLKTIYLLQRKNDSVRLIDIANRMSVTKPSANRAVAQLAEKDLVEHVKFGPILLTDTGTETAEKLFFKFDTIKRFLMLELNLSEDTANAEACAIEHSICDMTLGKMASLI